MEQPSVRQRREAWLVLGLFALALLICLLAGASVLIALGIGLLLFWGYGRRRGFSWRALGRMSLSGIRTIRSVLSTFLLIGLLTALWRAAGTLPVIVCCAAQLIRPSLFLVMTFLLNSLVSFLTGTSFGTSATMGVICATIGTTLGVSPVLTGGAVLSGAYFGDRCSPVSTSALLVSELTGTNLYQNIRGMLRSAALPFLLTCGLYLLPGFFLPREAALPNLSSLFARAFQLHWLALLPAAVVILLALGQVPVRRTLGASILTALPLCLLLQHLPPAQLPRLLLAGYRAPDPEVAALLNGGGLLSMLNVSAIVCLSASYSGIFRETGLLEPLQEAIQSLARRTGSAAAILCTSVAAGVIACNQTLTILLTHQLCADLEPRKETFALTLEDSAVVVPPLIPWSIAGAVPLAAVGAPPSAVLCAFFLILLPLQRLVRRP